LKSIFVLVFPCNLPFFYLLHVQVKLWNGTSYCTGMGHFLIEWLIALCIKLGNRRHNIRKANDECICSVWW
jgi:hypothetical protein